MGTAPNLDKLCRICTAEQTDGILIFSEDGKKLYLEAKMKKYLYISVSSDDSLPKMVCMNCCKKLDSIHRFASMAVKMQDKLKTIVESRAAEDLKKEHSILHSILSKGSEPECEVTEVEVRVDPMLFLCALEDGSSDGEDNATCNDNTNHLNTPQTLNSSEAEAMTVSPVLPVSEKELKPYRCSVCARGFNNEIGLQNHLWSHLPRDRRVLSNSDSNHMQRFKTQSNLYRHKDYHGGVQFPCGVCGRVYPTNSTLRAHSITHSDLRPHACPLCDKTFKRNQDLKVGKRYLQTRKRDPELRSVTVHWG